MSRTPEQIAKSKELMRDRKWRLFSGKLYKIKDKDGKVIDFIPNPTQQDFIENIHTKNIILKARQIWFSTMIQIYLLDQALFNRNFKAWVIAQDKETAISLFKDKIKFAFDNLPERLKKFYIVKTDRANELEFENTWSSIRVSTSFRWGTLQWLHISEYGKICAKYPLNANEIKDGALESVWMGNKIFIESTAEWWEWIFYDMCQEARKISDSKREPNDLEYKLFFYPRYEDPKYSTDQYVLITQEEQDYLAKYENIITLTQWQKNWYVLKRREKQDWMFKEYPTTYDEAFWSTLKWAYYETQIRQALVQNRIGIVKYNHQLPVHVAFDLWWSWWWDDTAIWFFQQYANQIYIIDYREWTWYWWLEILWIVQNRGYKIWRWIWPHDITANFTGESRRTMAKNIGITFEVLERMPITDWITIVRQTFPRLWFDKEKCDQGIKKLSIYRRSRDETNWVRRDRPQHNGASHSADALRYLCSATNKMENEMQPDIIDMVFNI